MKTRKLLAFLGAMALAGSAWGASFSFNSDGLGEATSQTGSARFDFSSDLSTLTLTLTNNQSPTELIMSELVGLNFSFSSTLDLTLQSVNGLAIDCTNTASPCPPAGSNPPNYSWALDPTGSSLFFSLGAGGGSYQPYGIINSNYNADGSTQLSNPATNPLLVGPVTFTFSIANAAFLPEITNVTFLFDANANGAFDGIPVPEPQSLALVGIGLLSLAFIRRRRK